MNRNFLEFGLSAWWILPAIIVAIGLAFLLYQKKTVPWSRNKNIVLGSLRFLAVLLILLLFLSPVVRKYQNEIERPIVVVGVDNTSSISSIHNEDELRKIRSVVRELFDLLEDDKDCRVVVRNLSAEEFDSLNFDESKTDFSLFFNRITDEFSGKNLKAIVILSDGIYNRGSSPAYRSFNFPVVTMALGDSIPQKDIAISRVRNNDVAYSGNEFPVEVEITRDGFDDQSIELSIRSSGKTLEKVTLEPGKDSHVFFITAEEEGVKRFTIETPENSGEVTFENNRHDLFLEILESKKKILISGISPHPDMKAIRGALELTGNYDIIMQLSSMNPTLDSTNYDVQIIFDGAKKISAASGFWLINSGTDAANLAQVPFVNVQSRGSTDLVTPSLNSDFSSFKLNREVNRLKNYPPVAVPFGEYTLSGPFEVLFYQTVGSVVTDKPLVAVVDDGTERMAVSFGQGVWQWRLQETARYGDQRLFTEFVQKLVQYLSVNENKKQFRVERGLDSFTENEVVFFDVEIYNDIFQFIEGQSYSITIMDESKQTQSYEFVFGSENRTASTNTFPPGTYSYTAVTNSGGKVLRDAGQFVVNALQLEQRQLTADHDLLREISEKSGGRSFHLTNEKELMQYLKESNYSGVIHSQIKKSPLINFFWVLAFIATLLSAEWVLRKVWGAY